jgi:hypothetical protein
MVGAASIKSFETEVQPKVVFDRWPSSQQGNHARCPARGKLSPQHFARSNPRPVTAASPGQAIRGVRMDGLRQALRRAQSFLCSCCPQQHQSFTTRDSMCRIHRSPNLWRLAKPDVP